MHRSIRWSSVLAAAAILAAPAALLADVYPSGLRIGDDNVNQPCEVLELVYVVNENADGGGGNPGLKVEVLNSSSSVVRTITKATRQKGVHAFLWDGRDGGGNMLPDGDYSVRITTADDGHGQWTQISDDSNHFVQFEQPRSLAVNTDPTSPYYGRVYVSVSRTGTTATGRITPGGIYLLNADLSDALGQGDASLTGGLTWGLSTIYSMRHIEVGPDDNIYISDTLDSNSNIFRVDPDVSSGSGVALLQGIGDTPGVHGSIVSSTVVEGSLAGNDLKLYAIDEDGEFVDGTYNPLYRWDVNGGPIPFNGAPVDLVHNAPLWIKQPAGVIADLDRGPDGKFYMTQYRFDGNQSGLYVLDANGTTTLWNSLDASRTLLGDPLAVDLLRLTYTVKVSPDGSQLAIVTVAMNVRIIPLVNGLPDLSQITEFTPFPAAAGNTNGTAGVFDAAGNLYVCDFRDNSEMIRVFSPPTGAHANSTTSAEFALAKSQVAGPTITTQPQDTVGYLGLSASFSVGASGGGLTYQWWRNGTKVDSGGNAASYQISGLTQADNGTVVKVVVCDGNGATVSEEAILTVTEAPECHDPFADADDDGDVDSVDFGLWQVCYTGPGDPEGKFDAANCQCFDRDDEDDVDAIDFQDFLSCWSGPAIPANPACDD